MTKEQIGLGNADNTSDANKPVSTAQQQALDGKADLGTDGKVPAAQLPSYVDDVLEYSSKEGFPGRGEAGKIYVATDSNLTYRWTGTTYVEISPSIALGETSSTAYRGDRGKEAYDHSQAMHARIDATKAEPSEVNGNIKIDGVESKVYDDTELANRLTELLDTETILKARAIGVNMSEGLGVVNLNRVLQLLLTNPEIESGVINNWIYKKYADGTAECWRVYSLSVQFGPTELLGGYYGGEKNIVLPSIFITAPIANVNVNAAGNACVSNVITSKTE